MRYAMFATLATAGTLMAGAASAMPLNNLTASVQNDDGIQQARLVCNRWGRCWNSRPRYYGGYYPQPYYGYYGRPYRYGYAAPGIGFHFGF